MEDLVSRAVPTFTSGGERAIDPTPPTICLLARLMAWRTGLQIFRPVGVYNFIDTSFSRGVAPVNIFYPVGAFLAAAQRHPTAAR